MLAVRAKGSVAPDRLMAVSRILNAEVLPPLKRALGPDAILPDAVVVTAASDGASVPDGRVPATMAHDGRIVSVDAPVVYAGAPVASLRFVLAHELAHYHDLTVRQRLGVRLRSTRATELWSEYFAQRVCWRLGHPPVAQFQEASASPGTSIHSGPIRLGGYFLVWTLAHHDAKADWLMDYAENVRAVLGELIPTMDPTHRFAALYQAFPKWSLEDCDWLERTLLAIDGFAIEREKRDAR